MQPAAPSLDEGGRQISFRLSPERDRILRQYAKLSHNGILARALAALIDLHCGKEIEKAEERAKELALPYQITRWSAPKLSTELIAYIAGLVRAGNMPEPACNLAGVSPRQRSLWTKRGRNDRAASRQSLQADFVAAVERAEAECEAEDIARLREHGKTTWTALAWRLERQYPDRYAQRKRIDGKVQHSVFPVVDWDRLSAVETRTLVELLRKASPELDDPGISRSARPALELIPADVIEGEAVELPEKPGP